MLPCYNRGCGQQYDPESNTDESCQHHPGTPFFHDAYKGWTCCNKKSVNFTEFLNMKGCTMSQHSNFKPPEPEKPVKILEVEEEIIVRKPIVLRKERPPFNSQLTRITPTVLSALKEAIDSLNEKIESDIEDVSEQSDKIPVGIACKNNGCKCSYSSESENSECQYHPGVPIFHEGLKFWSCCTKRTTDFTAFMNQAGCTFGKHKWRDNEDDKTVTCRYDWHQTASDVTIAIYAKMYHYERSSIELNPIRLKISLVFPQQDNAIFHLDLELGGIVNVEKTTAKMFGSKIEIIMPKAEPGTWKELNLPKPVQQKCDPVVKSDERSNESDSDVDLDDLQPFRAVSLQDVP